MKTIKKIILTAAALLAAIPIAAQRPTVGVVLCGGGAKGAAHVGVLKVLEENGIPIDYIAGTSMGAIVGALYAVGYSAAELDSLIIAQDWDYVMSDSQSRRSLSFENKQIDDKLLLQVPFGSNALEDLSKKEKKEEKKSLGLPLAAIRGQNIYNLFTGLTIGYQDSISFNDMPIPFACVAVDAVSKKEVVFHEGILAQAMRASMAIPGVFAPMRIGDMVLVDGGMTNNYPVDVAKEMGADIIIGVKLGADDPKDPNYDNVGGLFSELLNMVMNVKMDDNIKNTDIPISPSVAGYTTMSFDTQSLRALIDNGEKAARQKENELKELKSYLTRKEKEAEENMIGPLPRTKVHDKAVILAQDSIIISSITFNGITAKDFELLQKNSIIPKGEKISGKVIEEAVDKFYSTSAYSSVSYTLYGTESPYRLEFNFVQSPRNQLGLGVRFDSEEVSSVLLDLRFNHKRLYGSRFGISAKLNYNFNLAANYSYLTSRRLQVNLNGGFRHHTLRRLSTGLDFNDTYGEFSLCNNRKAVKTELGCRIDHQDYLSNKLLGITSPDYDLSIKRNNFASIFANLSFDRLDKAGFPNRGSQATASLRGYMDIASEDENPFITAQFDALTVLSLGSRFALIPSLHARALLGDHVPATFMNVMGGYEPGRYMAQQIPFYGLNGIYDFDKYLAVAALDLRVRIADNHFIFASANIGADTSHLTDFSEIGSLLGFRLGYAYDMALGPIAFNIHWSDYTRKVGAYFSIGYWF